MTVEQILPGDLRYAAVVNKRFNKRYAASPDYVHIVNSATEAASALADAVRDNRRIVVTSGGHCLEGFVSDPEVRVIIDVSSMKRVYHDAELRAIAVECGATVGETFRALHENWGTVIPLGEYPGIGIGGHVAGGAFGFLCREHGLAADYLYAVEVITVGADGTARTVLATREANDPNRELWWAHTGAGGGNFGIVTRYWFRSPNATGSDPRALLPKAPELVTTFQVEWNWSDLNESTFHRLLTNHGAWSEQHSAPDATDITLWSLLEIHRKQFGKIYIRGLTTERERSSQQIDVYLQAMCAGLPSPGAPRIEQFSWLEFALNPFPELFGMPPDGVSMKAKDAMLKQRFTDRQIAVAYQHLTNDKHSVMGGMLGFATYGGRVNAAAADATAAPQRNSIFDVACNTGWIDPTDADANLAWVREFYQGLFSETGGVPVPGERYDGSLINHPDLDHADPAFNKSDTPWHMLYFQQNYARLQQVKAKWDPNNIFHHALSVRV